MKVINQLQRENAELLEMLAKLHRDTFVYLTDLDGQHDVYMALMATMSETRTTIRHLGGKA